METDQKEESRLQANYIHRDVDTLDSWWQPRPLGRCTSTHWKNGFCHHSPRMDLTSTGMRFSSDATGSPVAIEMGYAYSLRCCIMASAKAMNVLIEHPYMITVMMISAADAFLDESNADSIRAKGRELEIADRTTTCDKWTWTKIPFHYDWPSDFRRSCGNEGIEEGAYETCFFRQSPTPSAAMPTMQRAIHGS